LGCAILGGAALAGYGLYCFYASSYGTVCYTTLFGAGSSTLINAPNSASNTGVLTKKIVNEATSVVQLIDPATSSIVHTTSLECFKAMVTDMSPYCYLINCRSLFNKVDIKVTID